MTQLEIAQQRQIERLEQQVQLMKNIATRDAFHHYFFKICKDYRTRLEAFEYLNQQYLELFGSFLFTDYTSFRQYNSRKNKSR